MKLLETKALSKTKETLNIVFVIMKNRNLSNSRIFASFVMNILNSKRNMRSI